MTTTIKGTDIINAVRAKVAAHPDFIYWPTRPDGAACRYLPNQEQPGCLFGQVLVELGFTIEEHMNKGSIGSALPQLEVEFTDEEETWMSTVQEAQDTGTPWAKAVEIADEEVKLP